jgi:predicted DNA binding protein
MNFLNIWQWLANKFLDYNYVAYQDCYDDVMVCRVFKYKGAIYKKGSYGYKIVKKDEIIFSTFNLKEK